MMKNKRTGARSKKDISPSILEQLNAGSIETASLVEWLAIDQRTLLKSVLEEAGRTEYLAPVLAKVNNLKKQTANTLNEAIGTELFLQAMQNKDKEFLAIMSRHAADMVRCWMTYAISRNERLRVEKTLQLLKPFAADTHFMVREVCWLSVRPNIITHLTESIDVLAVWVESRDENIRRFAVESTRPRGVWSPHIAVLKQNPELAASILEPLKSDTSRYVQDSVGNWLNDASKTQPEFVISLCKRWLEESDTMETRYITKQAVRTINKYKGV